MCQISPVIPVETCSPVPSPCTAAAAPPPWRGRWGFLQHGRPCTPSPPGSCLQSSPGLKAGTHFLRENGDETKAEWVCREGAEASRGLRLPERNPMGLPEELTFPRSLARLPTGTQSNRPELQAKGPDFIHKNRKQGSSPAGEFVGTGASYGRAANVETSVLASLDAPWKRTLGKSVKRMPVKTASPRGSALPCRGLSPTSFSNPHTHLHWQCLDGETEAQRDP